MLLAPSLSTFLEGIAAYCDHGVRFGVVESINTTIKAVLRRARGMRDEEMLLLKLKWATVHPIRSARDLARFLTTQPLYSNRVSRLVASSTPTASSRGGPLRGFDAGTRAGLRLWIAQAR